MYAVDDELRGVGGDELEDARGILEGEVIELAEDEGMVSEDGLEVGGELAEVTGDEDLHGHSEGSISGWDGAQTGIWGGLAATWLGVSG